MADDTIFQLLTEMRREQREDIQAVHTKIDTIQSDLAVMKKTYNKLEKDINGNGQKGLLERVSNVESNYDHCTARRAHSSEAKRGNLSNTIAIGALVVAVVTLLVNHFQ